MGTYTQVQFSMIVKPEFRDQTYLFSNGEWNKSDDPKFKEFGEDSRSSFIPNGYNSASSGGGSVFYNTLTGKWVVDCALKNYENTVEKFFELIPYFIESIEFLETVEETAAGDIHIEYDLIDNKVIEINTFDEYEDNY